MSGNSGDRVYWNPEISTRNISGFTLEGSQPDVLSSHWRNGNWPPSGTEFVPARLQNINNGLQVEMREKCYDSMSQYVMEHINTGNVPMMKRNERSYLKYATVGEASAVGEAPAVGDSGKGFNVSTRVIMGAKEDK